MVSLIGVQKGFNGQVIFDCQLVTLLLTRSVEGIGRQNIRLYSVSLLLRPPMFPKNVCSVGRNPMRPMHSFTKSEGLTTIIGDYMQCHVVPENSWYPPRLHDPNSRSPVLYIRLKAD